MRTDAAAACGAMMMALSLGACAPTLWVKDGATGQDFSIDKYVCEKDARQSGYFSTGLAGALQMRQFFRKCMVAYGWSAEGDATAQAGPTAADPNPAAPRAAAAPDSLISRTVTPNTPWKSPGQCHL